MIKKITAYILSICVMCTCVINFTVTAHAAEYGDYIDGWYHISNEDQLVALSNISITESHPVENANFVLDNDIIISDENKGKINLFSDSESPFSGVFDGNGHTIFNFDDASGITGGGNKGFFAFANGATIKNLTFDGADVDSVYCGGILISQAENSNIYNITIKNSNLQIISGGSVITLITSGGATGGSIAGVIDNCTLYNCEAFYTNVYVHNGEGITALAGDGYYMGGLVGDMQSSTLEYSRAIGDGETKGNGSVYVDSNIALALLSGKTAYVGGLVGMMENDSSIIDSFCSTYVSSVMVVDVPLLGGGDVRAGGIVSRINDGDNNLIERCHYSGLIESQALASHNINLGGIASYIDVNVTPYTRGTISNCFYNWDKAVGSKETPVIPVMSYNFLDRINIENSKSISASAYIDAENIWKPAGYDFDGNIERTSSADSFLGGPHANQWVIDETNNMPVHGTTSFTVYSNISNAFESSDVSSMEYTYVINANDTITVPTAEELSEIKPDLKNSGFIGIAFVSMRTGEGDTTIYTCDGIVEGGTDVPSDVVLAYGDSSDKAIYGVWCQAYTLGAQIGLNNDYSNRGLRVLTAVNTDLLDNIGLSEADVDYGRGATFTVDREEYIIEADSKEWRGERYITDKIDENVVDNARVFSIFLALDDNELDKEITYGGDILYNAVNSEGAEVILDYLCKQMKNRAGNIAETYIADLEKSGESADNYYGIGEDAYNNLMEYIA